MRKLAIATLAGLVALSAPALAQATGRHGHHHHRGHTRFLHLGAAFKSSTTTPASDGGGNETAGSVFSFEEGVLTLTLKSGKISGLVTEQTEISCEPSAATAHAADSGSDGNAQGDDAEESQPQPGDDGPGDQEEHAEPSTCGTSLLVSGATVRAAELRIGASGAVFQEIELVG